MAIKTSNFGKLKNGQQSTLYELSNKDIKLSITDFGASIQGLKIKNKQNLYSDVVLGYDSVDKYEKDTKNYFGATIGRNANRIQNGQFTLNGVTYHLEKNNGNHNLHSGKNGFSRQLWQLDNTLSDFTNNTLCLKLYDKEQDGYFPANLDSKVIYRLTQNNEIIINYKAYSDKDTIYNPTNHSYFNLNGHQTASILKTHKLQLQANYYTENDSELIPTGTLIKVHDDYSYLNEKLISTNLDTNFVINQDLILNNINKLTTSNAIAKLTGINSQITLEVYTTAPGIQVYTGEFIDESIIGKNHTRYNANSGICLETQFFPDAINKANFIKPILEKEQAVSYYTVFKFSN